MQNNNKMIMVGVLALSAILLFSSNLRAQTLPQAIQRAMYSNPDLLFNRARTLAAEQAVKVAQGNLLPSVDLFAGWGREATKSPATAVIDPVLQGAAAPLNFAYRHLTRTEAGLEILTPLFAGGALINEVKRNQNLMRAEEWGTIGIANDIALDVSEQYLAVIRDQELVVIAEDNLEAHSEIMTMIEERHVAGITREAELDQAEGRLALAESNLIAQGTNLVDARTTFLRVVGELPRSLVKPTPPPDRVLPASMDDAAELAVLNNPTLKAANADIDEAKSQHQVAVAANFPVFDLVLAGSRNRNLDGLIGVNFDNIAIFRASYNVFRGGSDVARARETAYQIQEAFEVRNNTYRQTVEAIRLSWNAFVNERKRVPVLDRYRVASRKTLAAYGEQFNLGQRTLLDLLDQQAEYYIARIDYVSATYNELLARFRMLADMGQLVSYAGALMPHDVYNTDTATSYENMLVLKQEQQEKMIETQDRIGAKQEKRVVKEEKKQVKQAAGETQKLAKQEAENVRTAEKQTQKSAKEQAKLAEKEMKRVAAQEEEAIKLTEKEAKRLAKEEQKAAKLAEKEAKRQAKLAQAA
ncbi:MAG: TolC family outer membrane protein [Gammaproteobacteria bacterium]